jgi:ABC-2 type transport system ATP-binding protein
LAGATVTTEPTLRVDDIGMRYGDLVALRDISFAAKPGERVALIGPNGAGKTTLLSILAGIQRPSSGRVSLDREHVGWVPQHAAVYRKLSVAENLRLFARLEKVPDVEEAVQRMLAQTRLAGRADDEVGTLSGGNRQRVNIAVGLLADPRMLLLDERRLDVVDVPGQGDELGRRAVEEQLGVGERAEAGTTILFSTHNVGEAERYADRLLVLADAELLFDGTPAEFVALAGDVHDVEAAFVRFLHARGH